MSALRESSPETGLRLARVGPAAVEAALVLIGFSAFVCVLFWGVTTALGSTVIGHASEGSDAPLTVWWFWRLVQEGGYHVLGTTHHTLTGAPFGWDESNGINLQWLLPYYPGYVATKLFGPVAAYNLVLLAGYVLSGAAMYLLVRYLGCKPLVAAWAGMVYVVFPWHLERAIHASLVHLEVLPLTLLALVAASRRTTWPRLSLVGLATLAAWLTSGYYGPMAVAAAGAYPACAALASRDRPWVRTVVGPFAAALVATIAFSAVALSAGADRATVVRSPSDLRVFGLRAHELVVPAPRNVVLGDWLGPFYERRLHDSGPGEVSNYLGLLTIVLALAWIVLVWRRRAALGSQLIAATAGLLGVFACALLFAWPSPVTLFGQQVPMPSRLVWEVLPAFRTPGRWVVLALAALVPLAALALQAAVRKVESRRGRAATLALVGGAMVVSFLELAVPPADMRFGVRPPAVYSAVAREPGIVADYPPVRTKDPRDFYLWQYVHGRPLLNGAPDGTRGEDASLVLLDPLGPGTAEELAFLGVRAIVTHPGSLPAGAERDRAWRRSYALVSRDRGGSALWHVVAPPAPALATLPNGFGAPLRSGAGVVRHPLTSPSGVGYVELTTRTPGVVRLRFDAWPPLGKKAVLRVADRRVERRIPLDRRRTVSVLVWAPRGRSLVLVKIDPPTTDEDEAVNLGSPRVERASGSPELRALLVYSDPRS